METTLISAEALASRLNDEELLIIDTRPNVEFIEGFVPGSISAGNTGKYDKWILEEVGNQHIVLVTSTNEEQLVAARIARFPIQGNVLVLEGGFGAWKAGNYPIDLVIEVEPDELALDLPHDPNLQLIDLRGEEAFEEAHVIKAQHIPLAELIDLATIANFDEDQQLYLYCDGGHSSVLGASIIKRQGVHNLRIVSGGFDAIELEKAIPIKQKPAHS